MSSFLRRTLNFKKKSPTNIAPTIRAGTTTIKFENSIDYYQVPPPIIVPYTLKDDLFNLLDPEVCNLFADVWFKGTDKEDLIPAHKCILKERCSSLKTVIDKFECSRPNSQEHIPIEIPFSSATFIYFLHFVYTGTIKLTNSNERENMSIIIESLFSLAQQWQILDLAALIMKSFSSTEQMNKWEKLVQVDMEMKLRTDMLRVLNTCSSNSNTFTVKFTFDTGELPILAHKSILSQRCSYFRAMFTGGTREKNSFEVAIHDMPSTIFQLLLEYCYTDHVEFIDDTNVIELFIAADRFCMENLKAFVSARIAKGVTVANVLQIYQEANRANANELKNFCHHMIVRRWNTIAEDQKRVKILSEDEIEIIKIKRSRWRDVDEMENFYWSNEEDK